MLELKYDKAPNEPSDSEDEKEDKSLDIIIHCPLPAEHNPLGHSCKIGNMRCPGTLKNQNPQFEEKK